MGMKFERRCEVKITVEWDGDLWVATIIEDIDDNPVRGAPTGVGTFVSEAIEDLLVKNEIK